MRGLAITSLSLLALTGLAAAQDDRARLNTAVDLPGPIDTPEDIRDTANMLFKMADTNQDNRISQQEVLNLANMLVGGLFFAADQNGDGTVSQEEARAAREQQLMRQSPLLRALVQEARKEDTREAIGAQGSPNQAQALRSLLDANNDRQLQAAEVRQAAQTAVQAMFAAADTDRDNQLTGTEINAALIGAARQAEQAAFQRADADHNGQLSEEEYKKAIVGPALLIFRIVDTNDDHQLSPEEAQRAQQIIAQEIRYLREEPGPPLREMIRDRTQRGGAPPAFGSPNPPARTTPTAGTPAPVPR